jgi:hypothetical protein
MRKNAFAMTAAAGLLIAGAAQAEISDGKIKIGVLTDLSGGYEQNSGSGSVEAAKMAAEEFGNKINGKPIEIVAADHQNKPTSARPSRARGSTTTRSTPSSISSTRRSVSPCSTSPSRRTRWCC